MSATSTERYFWVVVSEERVLSNSDMFRRTVATTLWGYFGWYLAAHVVSVLALPPQVAPAGGVAVALFASIDLAKLRELGVTAAAG